jgi:hypothetical protein
MSIDLTIHGTGIGQCSLSGKEGEGIVVTFKDGTLREGFLSYRAFQQLIKMKFAPAPKPLSAQPAQTVPTAAPVTSNGPAK